MSDRKFLPHHSKVYLLKDGANKDRSRSTRLGIVIGLLNFPRMVFMGLFASLKVILITSFCAALVFFLEVVYHPIFALYTAIMLGRHGLLIDADEVEEDAASDPIVMFDRRFFDEVSMVMRGRETE